MTKEERRIFALEAEALEERRKRWRAVQDRLKDKGFTINEIKPGNVMEKITFLGFTISGSGSEPDDSLVNKVRKIHAPQSVKEVEQFCGLVNFYGGFI